MTYTSAEGLLSRDMCFPLPPVALAPAAWYLGAHMLKCLQEASSHMMTHSKARRLPQSKKSDKSTQTVVSAVTSKKAAPGRKSPAHKGHRRQDSKGEEIKKSARGGRKSACEMAPSANITKQQSPAMRRHSSDDFKNVQRNEVADVKESGMPLSLAKSRSMRGGVAKGRRVSMGDCPKRTSDSCAETVTAKWLKNPVYVSDGESDGVRTDRSEMSPPWLDISIATKQQTQEHQEATSPGSRVMNLVKSVKKHNPVRVRTTQPKMEAVPETSRSVNLRKDFAQPAVSDATPKSMTTGDKTLREILERKLGKDFAAMNPTTTKALSEQRVRELTEKYAGKKPVGHVVGREGKTNLRARDSADSIYHRSDLTREEVAF